MARPERVFPCRAGRTENQFGARPTAAPRNCTGICEEAYGTIRAPLLSPIAAARRRLSSIRCSMA